MPSSECIQALASVFGERARVDTEQLEKCAWDFGRMIRRTPAVVVSVRDVEELFAALRIGAQFNMPICTRGSGHSQSGQCLAEGALVIDMKSLSAVQIDAERGSGWLSGGATWHQVSNAAFAQGFMPVGLTMIVDTTVGGTLSVGGVGAESFRTGMQVDQVLELEVATLDGNLVRCSGEQHRDLFDAVRAGLGQCGVIVQARYPLRRAKARVRSYMLAYADSQALISDMQLLGTQLRCDFMFAALLWSEQGGWQLLLLLGKEFDNENELDDAALLSGLQCKRELARTDALQWQSDGSPEHRFFRRFEEQVSDAVRHPWADQVSEPRATAELLSAVVSEPPVAARAGTCGALHLVAPHPKRAPLVLPRTAAPLIVFGMFPEPSAAQLPAALAYMQRHNQRGAALGAKRYLSDYFDGWGEPEWSAHFGDAWSWFRSQKERFDSRGLLNNGCIRWR